MKLYVVGFGSGSRDGMTFAADAAIRRCDLVIGYQTYTALMQKLYPEKTFRATGMRQETERVHMALESAETQDTALICSGDPELYGMAGLALSLGPQYPDAEIEIVPGVSAAFSGGALLGAPLTHDFAVISLSDLLTPADKIQKRLRAAAEADFVIVLYNPASHSRKDYLQKACDIVLESRSPETVCGIVRQIGREGQTQEIMPLSALRDYPADMFTTVFIGNSETAVIGGRMVTPRGYRNV